MEPLDERPQIGMIAVETSVLAQNGIELDVMLTELNVELRGAMPTDTPRLGWRVLTSVNGEVATIGAPTDDDGQWWRLGQIRPSQGEPGPRLLALHPTLQRRRPSIRDRAGGLSLRWPAVTREAPDLDLLAIDIVNAGGERWLPQGDSFMVFAALRQPGGPAPGVYFGYVAGQYPALPLDPGEYARVRVVIDAGQWDDAHAGPYEVHAFLVDLGLRGADVLPVELTDHDVQSHLPRRPLPPPPAR
ncbi:hypothetical protein [Cryobacterium sp. N22]|uniref:hypothetical protein n=1 Tax=Cryobacterium sp. N22 TaxID=2048290 RepID=UPI000CE35063|nr:hypothetical protein [Cryobacterium sp. N22]